MEPRDQLRAAERTQAAVRRGGRWYPAWAAVFGLASVVVVTCVPVLQGYWAILFAAILLVWIYGLQYWRSRQLVQPVGERRALLRWMLPWVVLYLVAVGWVGPTWLGGHVGWWALTGVVVAVPAFAEAAVSWWRLR